MIQGYKQELAVTVPLYVHPAPSRLKQASKPLSLTFKVLSLLYLDITQMMHNDSIDIDPFHRLIC